MLMEAPRSLRNASVGRGETKLVVWSSKEMRDSAYRLSGHGYPT